MRRSTRSIRLRLLGWALATVAAVGATAAFAAAPAAAYTCPGNPSPVWGCPAFGAWKADGIFNWRPSVTVIGDSLIQGLRSDLANQLTSTQMFWGHTFGVGGSSFFHWNNGLDGKETGGWIGEHDPKHSVLALGTNDAAKLGTGAVTRREVTDQIAWAMERAWQETQRCVIVIGPSRHNASPTMAQYVRGEMAFYVWTRFGSKPAGHRFVWFDWDAHSAAHPEWFLGPNDPHMTTAGKQAYRDAITYVAAATDVNGC
ncbi:hypothetical protein Cwoe_3852 [Conexibacter woesei DSM 14684]|uniref:Lipolytic protein G-D-S-L family n=1 Tax=Conexibacter woesei (strain DSM 14684 / CCUG 47730 / CIP 108061 / JCM 11494 / NBRC 100937 / ID131577) TaxID=469383 RepID=D3F2K3_CONWI|nr:hypothetical protein Cwoe_3852 [Conexibacter woesei DSM 14684]